MTTPSDLYATISSAVATLLADSDGFALASVFDVRDQVVPRDSTGYQLQAFVTLQEPVQFQESNVRRDTMSVKLLVHHALGTSESEISWANGGMQDALATLLTPAWWNAISGVDAVVVEPVGSIPTRTGNVVSFSVALAVTVNAEA
jgi:hypothetical protein